MIVSNEMPLYKNKSINNYKILWYRQTEKKSGEEFENSSSVCLASGQLQPNDCGHQPCASVSNLILKVLGKENTK